MSAEKKIGAYICQGCGLGDRLDTKQLAKVARSDGKAAVVKEHEFLCNADGVAMIRNDIANDGVNRVVIAGCSRRAKSEAFVFEGVGLSRANLREGVIWVRPDTDDARETTQEMAEDYVRMACAEAKLMNIEAPSGEQELLRSILVVGGGIAGMTSAIEAAATGYEVHLVEKSGQLGGIVGQLWRRVPEKNGLQGPVDTGVAAMIESINSNGKIKVYLNSTITSTEGAPGRFNVAVTTESGATQQVKVGAVVQATGFKPYDITRLPELGGGQANVVDQLGFEAMVKSANGGALKRSDGKEIKSVVFVQCAGQRSEKEGHLPYCSGHCCLTSIKQATYIRQMGGDATILFDDLRTPGATGEDFYRSGQKAGVTFAKASVSGVEGGSAPKVKFKDMLLTEESVADADLVVLASGMVPNSGPHPYIEADLEIATKMKDEKKIAELNAMKANPPESILNLDYRQGTDLPQLKHGFTDSHFICFPYETRRTGIYSCGPVRRPMDITQTIEDATGATLKAIQACENAAMGRAAHPRSGDLSFPRFRKEGCTQCKRCTVECPFGAINEDEQRYPQFNEARCRRCGTCMGACPVRVISFENYSVDTVGQQIKNCSMPEEFDEKPRILVLACENDAYPALDMAGMTRQTYSQWARVVPVRCLGSVNTIWITDALNSGFDGVILMGCQKGDNYQCHFVKGSEMAHYRMSKVDETLKSLNLEQERVQTFEVSITDIQRLPKIINDMQETIGKIGLSPFKF
jgi:quinone-modifying oxidoreductase, subunit QmoB